MALKDFFKTVKHEIVEGYQSFSTPFLKVGGANLTLPYVNGRNQTNGYIPFGQDNLFPELLNQIYYSSPLHGSIVGYKVNAAVGGGFNIVADRLTPQDKLELYTLERKLNIKKIVPAVTQQLILHNRVYFKLCFDDKMKLTKVMNLSPEKLRVNLDKKRYYICDDWSSRIGVQEIKRYTPTSRDL
jgi:hypothetical protein